MGLLLMYWSFLAVGYIVGAKLKERADKFHAVQKAVMLMVYIMVLIMGLRMGVNEQVTSNLGTIGIQSLVITFVSVVGSILAIALSRKFLSIDKFGNAKGTLAEENISAESSKVDASDIKSTLVILSFVIIGMAAGCFIIAGMLPEILPAFDKISSLLLSVFLCILLWFVGFDLGLSGNVAANIKSVGFKVLVFPFAAVIGTLIFGTAACMIFGFSIREGLAISAGFGWYTYAPSVIASAGEQYMVASAVSFMYNVIRETAGIILIPILAKKIGYLEVTGIPGVAAMDVCMPIVERSCRHDTVVYSFAIGLLMCIVTSILVPIAMGV